MMLRGVVIVISFILSQPGFANLEENETKEKQVIILDQTASNPRICVSSHEEKVCVTRQVCRIVCTTAGAGAGFAYGGGGLGAAMGTGAATQVCNNVCDNVPECVTTMVCTAWQGANP